jgi:hypothetical protein
MQVAKCACMHACMLRQATAAAAGDVCVCLCVCCICTACALRVRARCAAGWVGDSDPRTILSQTCTQVCTRKTTQVHAGDVYAYHPSTHPTPSTFRRGGGPWMARQASLTAISCTRARRGAAAAAAVAGEST